MKRTKKALLLLALVMTGCKHQGPDPVSGSASLRNGQTLEELYERGRAFALIGDLTRGEQYLSAALEHGGDPRKVLPPLVHICVEAGRYRVAADYVRAYMNAAGDRADLHLLYGLLEAAVGDRELARREYEIVLRLQPDDSAGHYALAVLFRDAMVDAKAANTQFREYLRLAPDGEHAAEARAALASFAP
jgi:tetratricopeptide (TPR) repeat protein